MANVAATRIRETKVGMFGGRSSPFRMFGNAGATGVDLGSWIQVDWSQWKGFQLYPLDQGSPGAIGTSVVDIEGAMELNDPTDPFSDAVVSVIDTLNSGNVYDAIETPYRWVRARVTSFDTDAIQVGLLALS